MLLSFTACTYSAQFFNGRRNNWLNTGIGSCQSNGLMRDLNRPRAPRGHVTNASFKQYVKMPKIDGAHRNYLTPEIWEETHLREKYNSIRTCYSGMQRSSLFLAFLGCGLTKCVLFKRIKIDFSEILPVLDLLNLNWSRRFSALRFAARQKKNLLYFLPFFVKVVWKTLMGT